MPHHACDRVCRAAGCAYSHLREVRGPYAVAVAGQASCLPVVCWQVSELRLQSRVVWSQARDRRAARTVTSVRCRAMCAIACAGLRGEACSRLREARGAVCRSCGGGGRVQGGAHAAAWGTKKRGIRGRFGLHPTPGMSCTAPCVPCTVSCAHVRDALHHVLCHARVCAVRHVHCVMYVMYACALCATSRAHVRHVCPQVAYRYRAQLPAWWPGAMARWLLHCRVP